MWDLCLCTLGGIARIQWSGERITQGCVKNNGKQKYWNVRFSGSCMGANAGHFQRRKPALRTSLLSPFLFFTVSSYCIFTFAAERPRKKKRPKTGKLTSVITRGLELVIAPRATVESGLSPLKPSRGRAAYTFNYIFGWFISICMPKWGVVLTAVCVFVCVCVN